MHDLAVLFVHLITTVLRIAQPGGLREVLVFRGISVRITIRFTGFINGKQT